ncbi:MAG: hypothetical protein K9N23_10605 [Akkermansiaceae bacterium]|nr:hypothetical protein [Akkermansiaceae bacterium]MCF7732131.1 hypothetical protein [Akkermansiaceae bacterium]
MSESTMTAGKIKLLAKQAAVFAVSAVSVWTLKPILRGQQGPTGGLGHQDPVPVAIPEDPDDLSQLDSRLALADELLDADTARFRKIAVGMLGKQNVEARAWTAVFTCWMKIAPDDAWAFATLHADTTYNCQTHDSYLPDPQREQGTLRPLAAREWAKLDPRAARAVLAGPGDPAFETLLLASLDSDVEYGFSLLAEQLAAGMPPPKATLFDNPLAGGFTALARKNPQLALEWAQRLASGDYSAPLVIGWADHDWSAARLWLDQHPERAEIIDSVARLLASDTGLYRPQLFDLILHSLPPGGGRLELVQQTLANLADADPVRAVEEAERAIADPDLRASIMARIAGNLAHADPKQALEILTRIAPGTTGLPCPDLRAEYIIDGKNPVLADYGTYILSLIGGNSGITPAEVMSDLLGRLIWTDKAQTLRYLDRFPADQIAIAGTDAIDTWASHDPLEAAAWLAGKVGDHGDDLRIDHWFGGAKLTPDEMGTLSTSLPGGAFRDAFTAWAAGEFAEQDPAWALAFARTNEGNPAALTEVYQQWAATAPQAALEALAADTQAPPEAWAEVVGRAWENTPGATSELVESMEPGTSRDAALEALVVGSGHPTPPPQQVAWACGIMDETKRNRQLESLLDRMSLDLRQTRDATIADTLRTVIQTTGNMSAPERERWLTRIDLDFPPPP